MSKKVHLLLETISWLDDLKYGVPINKAQYHVGFLQDLNESLTGDDDVKFFKTKKYFTIWRQWMIKSTLFIHDSDSKHKSEGMSFTGSRGMQLYRIPAWRNYLLSNRSFYHWKTFVRQRKLNRLRVSLKVPRQISKKYKQRMMIKFWCIWTHHRQYYRQYLFQNWIKLLQFRKVLRKVRIKILNLVGNLFFFHYFRE
jgi:hypothetical protein